MAKIGVFDLCSFFWTVAGTRKRGEDPYGLALQVLRYIRACADKVGVEDVIFGADGPSGRSFRRSVCAKYKAGREAKDPEMVAELAALTTALLDAGFTVSTIAVGPVGDVDGTAEYFEGDDVVASFAVTILKDPTAEVCIGSNDWDLAPLLAFPKVRLFTTRGEERTAADVKEEFGVEPLMLPQLKALAGDSDGYKPFPGLEKGKPGIGDKTAAAILEKFGSAEAAVKAALLRADVGGIGEFEGLPARTATLLKAGGEAALRMGLVCAKLRTDAPVPTDVNFGEWDDVERALLDRQKAQRNEPRPEVVVDKTNADAALTNFREAAHAQLARTDGHQALDARIGEIATGSEPPLAGFARGLVEEVKLGNEAKRALAAGLPLPTGRIGEFTGEGAVPDLIGRPRDPKGLGVSDLTPAVTPLEFAKAAVEAFDGPIAVTPLSMGQPIEAFRDNPFTDDSAPDLDGPCPDGKCAHTRGEHAGITGEEGCGVVGCPCMSEDHPNFKGAKPAPAPRKRRSSRGAQTVTVDLDPDGSLAAIKDGVVKAAIAVGSPEPTVFVLLTEAEFIALAPLPALAAAGLLTPPKEYADKFYSLIAALREGLLRPCDGVFIGSVGEPCARGLSELGAVASCVMNGLEVLASWRSFVDQLHVLPRFTDLAKYGGKLVRA